MPFPKTIHYCWFGGKEIPEKGKRCIESWQRHLPSFTVKRWDETNFNVNETPYTRYCYENKLWAFLSDYVRLRVVEQEGGIYFDTDVEVITDIDNIITLMQTNGATAFFGFETSMYINTGLGFGATAHHPALRRMIEAYTDNPILDARHMTGCPTINTNVFTAEGATTDGTMQTVLQSLLLPPPATCAPSTLSPA